VAATGVPSDPAAGTLSTRKARAATSGAAPASQTALGGRVIRAVRGRRVLVDGRWIVSFVSASYLGIEQDPRVHEAACRALGRWGVALTTPRILGADRLTLELEDRLAHFTGQPAAMVFPSTTHVALDTIPLLVAKGGVVFVDTWAYPTHLPGIHAAQRAGARVVGFPHNDIDALKRLVARAGPRGSKVIVADGIYPEGGPPASIETLITLAEDAGATLYVDDSHGLGVLGTPPATSSYPYGRGGGGVVRWSGRPYTRGVLVGTLSKSIGVPVAFLAGSAATVRTLRRASSAVVHSNPPAIPNIAAALAALDVHEREGDQLRRRIAHLVRYFRQGLARCGLAAISTDIFPLQAVSCGTVRDAVAAGRALMARGVWPVVQAGSTHGSTRVGTLRFPITARHSVDDLEQAVNALCALQADRGAASR